MNSDAPEFLFIMRGSIAEGCRPNEGPQPHNFVAAKIPFLRVFIRNASKWYLRTLWYMIVQADHKNSGTYLSSSLSKNLIIFFLRHPRWSMDEQTVVTCGTDDDDDDPLIFLYFGAQGLQTLWRCKRHKSRLQKRKIYFPIMYAREKASTRIKRWWLHRRSIRIINN